MRNFFNQILETLKLLHQRHPFGVNFRVALIGGVLVVFFLAYHISTLLFGTNSVSVYFSLLDRKEFLQNQIDFFHVENAKLQKMFFELKNLEPGQ